MKAIGVRELKAQLSRFLHEVEAGEVVLVTDRGRVIAELRQPGLTTEASENDLDRRLRRMAERHPLRLGDRHDPASYEASPVRAAPGTAAALLGEEREE